MEAELSFEDFSTDKPNIAAVQQKGSKDLRQSQT